jgi:hypothetical protein
VDALLFVGLKCDKMAFKNAIGMYRQLGLTHTIFCLTVVLQPMQGDVRHVADADTME